MVGIERMVSTKLEIFYKNQNKIFAGLTLFYLVKIFLPG